MENKESFVFYRSFKESIGDLSDKDKLTMYEAISDYGLNQIEPELQGFPKALFSLIKPQLDANFTRWKNGCKGGAPKGSRNNPNGRPKKEDNKPITNQELTENKANVNDNDNVNVNGIKKVIKKVKLSFDQRQTNFYESLRPYTEEYGKDMIRSFFDHWSAPLVDNPDKMLKEDCKAWSLEGRLRTWKRKESIYGK